MIFLETYIQGSNANKKCVGAPFPSIPAPLHPAYYIRHLIESLSAKY